MSRSYMRVSTVLISVICFQLISVCPTIGVAKEHDAPSRRTIEFEAQVQAGEQFERPFGDRFTFFLTPISHGWLIQVKDERGTEDLSRFTPPFHFVPNPRFLEGWHFRNADNTGPNEAGPKNVNAPGKKRDFIFSPEVGRSIQGPESKTSPSREDIEQIRSYGQGTLTIEEYRLKNLEPGKRAHFQWLRFRVRLTWSRSETK